MKDVLKDKEIFEGIVIECFYNICEYYNNDIKIIRKYTNEK